MAKTKKKKLSKEEKERRINEKKFKHNINAIFTNASFIQIPTRNVKLNLKGRDLEVDNVFIFENIIVISEDTTFKSSRDIRDHLNNKSQVFDYIQKYKVEFIDLLSQKFEKMKNFSNKYLPQDAKIIFIYCSLNKFDKRYKERHPNIIFMDYPHIQYFLRLSKIISKSIRFEIFKFLKVSLKDIGFTRASRDFYDYHGFFLPESPTGFPKGHMLVSFLVEPKVLLEQSYVLRKDSWLDYECLYQRLLIPNKIRKMREYLDKEGRVFINNIIITLPPDTEIYDRNKKQLNITDISKRQDIVIRIPRELDNIGIIDGQHRVFSYHEGLDKADKKISLLREKQHLLLTGIIYPNNIDEYKRIKFEAQLFLEINDKQTRARADLKQAIETIVNPYSVTAISKRILTNLSNTGPLTGQLEEYFYDTRKIKTSSIVSYGLNHLVKFIGQDSLFSVWSNPDKSKLLDGEDRELLELYIDYCTKKINDFLIGFRKNISDEMWTLDKKLSRVLTTTTINGLINCLRKLIENNKLGDIDYYNKKLKNMKINFSPIKFPYKSSHWKALGEKIYFDCFE